jgi:hypothetical protein
MEASTSPSTKHSARMSTDTLQRRLRSNEIAADFKLDDLAEQILAAATHRGAQPYR